MVNLCLSCPRAATNARTPNWEKTTINVQIDHKKIPALLRNIHTCLFLKFIELLNYMIKIH